MHYYYDVLANLDVCLWDFYEWESADSIIALKKVPLVRVSEKDLKNFLQYQITFDSSWIQNFLQKTVVKNQKERGNCILFSSTKNNILFEIDEKGMVLSRSKLLMEDENNCNEVSFAIKEENVPYKMLNKLSKGKELRQASKEKHLIEVELKTLASENNVKKCTYLYYEWFGIVEDHLDVMIDKMTKELKKEYSLKIHEIAQLIKMSYKECL